MSTVVPPTTAGSDRVAKLSGGSAKVVVPPITTNEAEVSNEIATSLMVVCCPAVIMLVAPPTMIAERDGSIIMGPTPGKTVVCISFGREITVGAGGLMGNEGSTTGGGTGLVAVGRPGRVFWGNAGIVGWSVVLVWRFSGVVVLMIEGRGANTTVDVLRPGQLAVLLT